MKTRQIARFVVLAMVVLLFLLLPGVGLADSPMPGVVVTDFHDFTILHSVLLQPDGKVVAAGSAGFSEDFLALARYNSDGSLDPTFGTGGKVVTDLGLGRVYAFSVALQPDGKLVAAGAGFTLARFNPDGSLDPTFGVAGKVVTDIGTGSHSTAATAALVIQPDGKLVAEGWSDGGFALARFNPDGSLDPTFGTGGKVATPFATRAIPTSLVLQPDGKLVALGEAFDPSNPGCDCWLFALARYNPDGSLDPTFGAGGKVVTELGLGMTANAHSVALQPDGKLVVTGGQPRFALVRYNADGGLDPTFGAGGKVLTDFGGDLETGTAVVVQPDGKLVQAGFVVYYSADSTSVRLALIRYNADGTLDRTFGAGGKVLLTELGEAQAYSAVLQPDGKLVAAGIASDNSDWFSDYWVLARFNPDGSLDPTFGGVPDKTPPTITLTAPTNGATYLLNAPGAAAYTCTDADSGVSTCSGPVPAGTNFDTSTLGPHTFTVNASDNAGNATSTTNTYSVINTPPGNNVTVRPGSQTTITFASVSSAGNTTVAASSSGPTPPAGFSLGSPPTYYDIRTTATYSPPVNVCLTYDPAQFSDPSTLRLLHYENNTWVDATTSNDSGSHIICGQVSTLSPFVVAQKIPSATIQVLAALHTVGSGTNPGSTKTPQSLQLRVFDKALVGSPNPKDLGTIWNSGPGLVSPLILISGPSVVNVGGGQANLYTLSVPSSDPKNKVTSGSYLVIGKVTVSGMDIYVGSPTDPLTTKSVTQMYLQVIKNANGKIIPAQTTAVPGSLLLIAEPAYLEFTSDTELLPVIYESVEGTWDAIVKAEPPDGFVSNPGALSVNVTASQLQAVQFTVKDVGSSWTTTKVTHQLKHNGKDKTVTVSLGMINRQSKSVSTPSPTPTTAATKALTLTPTRTPTRQPSLTPTKTPTVPPTKTRTPTSSPTPIATPTITPIPSPTATRTATK